MTKTKAMTHSTVRTVEDIEAENRRLKRELAYVTGQLSELKRAHRAHKRFTASALRSIKKLSMLRRIFLFKHWVTLALREPVAFKEDVL